MCYDAGGVGAGVKGTWDTAETQLPFKAQPVLFGDSPGDDVWPDDQTSKQKFLNLCVPRCGGSCDAALSELMSTARRE